MGPLSAEKCKGGRGSVKTIC